MDTDNGVSLWYRYGYRQSCFIMVPIRIQTMVFYYGTDTDRPKDVSVLFLFCFFVALWIRMLTFPFGADKDIDDSFDSFGTDADNNV